MSHFSVLVLSAKPDEEELTRLFAPYDEEISAPARWEEEGTFWYQRILQENAAKPLEDRDRELADFTGNPDNVEDVLRYYCQVKYPNEAMFVPAGAEAAGDGSVACYKIENGRVYSTTTYNPLSKWDYWRVGGRWGGALKLKKGRKGLVTPTKGWDSPENIPKGHADQAYKRDIDIDGMRDEAEQGVGKEWDTFDALRKQHGMPTPISELFTQADAEIALGTKARDAAYAVVRELYWNHPIIKALADADLGGGPFAGPVEERFLPTRAEQVERARLSALPGYAVLNGFQEDANAGTPGTWMSGGEMGWFGMSTDDATSKVHYLREANRLIDALPDDAVLTMTDCHI